MKTASFLRRSNTAEPESEPTPLHDRVQAARDRLTHQNDPALRDALSERELEAERTLAERARDRERNEKLAKIEAAEKASNRLRNTTDELADQQARDLIDAEKAIAQQRHSSSPHTKVARLHRRRTLALRLVTSVLVIAMIVSAVSVQHNIAPHGGPANVWWWMAYGIEFLISGTLIALMMSTGDSAEWDVIDEPWKARTLENVLLGVTVVLNIFPFIANRDWGQAGAHIIAPIIIGTALHTYGVVATRYSRSIERATAKLSQTEHGDVQDRLAALTRISADTEDVKPAPTSAPEAPQMHPDVHSMTNMPSQVHPYPEVEGAHAHSEVHPTAGVQVHPHANVETEGMHLHPEDLATSEQSAPKVSLVKPVADSVHLVVSEDVHSSRSARTGADNSAELALELVRQGATTKPAEEVAEVLTQAVQGIALTTIAKNTGIHHKTVGKILSSAERIRRPRPAVVGGGRVIEFDRRTAQ